MKCLNCGRESENYLCDSCLTLEILENVFDDIRTYKPGCCSNPYLAEYASGLTEKYAERDIIPNILKLFDADVSEYFYCRYYRMRRDEKFEEAALAYLQKHDLLDIHTQAVLYDLIESYIPNDFIKPQKWCEIICETEGLSSHLYAIAAKYNAMIGEYDIADTLTLKGMERCEAVGDAAILFGTPKTLLNKLEKQKTDTERYRTKTC